VGVYVVLRRVVFVSAATSWYTTGFAAVGRPSSR